MTRPGLFLTRMAVILILVGAGIAVLFPQLEQAFLATSVLNGMILVVLLIGIGHTLRTVLMLRREVAWIEDFRREPQGEEMAGVVSAPQPRLLGPMATMLGEHERKGRRVSLSALSMRSLLDGIAARLDESRELSRYMIGLLVFLGLLGTFWGLLDTVSSVADVINALELDGGELQDVFARLKVGLRQPLSGMGTAFSSSLFGLAGSLVLGLLELQASQAQNRFYNDLEEWLSGLTRLSSGALGGEGEQSIPAYIQALLEQTADGLEGLQRTIAQGEEGRHQANQNLISLTDKLSTLGEQMRSEQALLMRLGESQVKLEGLLSRMGEGQQAFSGGGMDEASRTHLRNLDVYLARLVEEAASGRSQLIHEIRSEIRLLARTIAAIADEGEP